MVSMLILPLLICISSLFGRGINAFVISHTSRTRVLSRLHAQNHDSNNLGENISDGVGMTRRTLFRSTALVGVASLLQPTTPAQAVGPVKIDIINPTYTAAPCPKDKPIPGEKAMKGMRGLCVQVKAELAENSPKVCLMFMCSSELANN